MRRFSRSLRAVVALVALCAAPIMVPAILAQQTIHEAVSSGKLALESIQGTGASSGDSIKMKGRKGPRAGNEPVDATVPPGTKLASNSGGAQSMVVAGLSGEDVGNGMMRPASTIHLGSAAGATATYVLNAYCAAFEKDN